MKILSEETFWFNSKEKSPVLLLFEIFRVEELLENNLLFVEKGEIFEEVHGYDKKVGLISNINYLYYDYLLSKPICLQVFITF